MFGIIFGFLLFLLGTVISGEVEMDSSQGRPYVLEPFDQFDGVFGAEIKGLSLKELHQSRDEDVINQLKIDFEKYKMLLLRQQEELDAEELMQIPKYVADPSEELNCIHDDHPNAPHRCVVTFGNNKELGLHMRGRRWHLDGSQRENLDHVTVYKMVKIASAGKTVFIPSKQCVDMLTVEQRERQERLWYALVNGLVMPYLIIHPFTGEVVMRSHLYNFVHFIYDYGLSSQRNITGQDMKDVFLELYNHLEQTCADITYTHTWVEGDVLITDNLAMVHRADSNAFQPPEKIGPRVLHRTSTITARIPKPVRGYKSAEWEATCPRNEQGYCIMIENQNRNNNTDDDKSRPAEKKDEL